MNFSFNKTLDQIIKRGSKGANDFVDAEIVNVFWETKRRIIKKLLPPPLKPTKIPIAFAFVANFPNYKYGPPYAESALMIRAECNGEIGNYCIGMHVTSDVPMAQGREHLGYPKKLAQKMYLRRDGDTVNAWSERRGIRNLEMRMELTGKFNDEKTIHILHDIGFIKKGRFDDVMKAYSKGKMTNVIDAIGTSQVFFNYKHFMAPNGTGFDYNPRLIKQVTVLRPKILELGEAEIKLGSSIHDPWAEIEVVKALGAVYQVGTNTILNGDVIGEIEPGRFLKYAFHKTDWD